MLNQRNGSAVCSGSKNVDHNQRGVEAQQRLSTDFRVTTTWQRWRAWDRDWKRTQWKQNPKRIGTEKRELKFHDLALKFIN